MAWCDNFEKHWSEIRQRYGEGLYRMWEYYLRCCAGSFRAGRFRCGNWFSARTAFLAAINRAADIRRVGPANRGMVGMRSRHDRFARPTITGRDLVPHPTVYGFSDKP